MRYRLLLILLLTGCTTAINYDTPVDPKLQAQVEKIDASLRATYDMPEDAVDVGMLDLQSMRLAMIHPDKIEYAASVAKIGILLAWFHLHPEGPDAQTKHELGLMTKTSSNEMATKFSREMGIAQVQQIIESYGFYDKTRGGGIWFGKHYGPNSERFGDPVADHSHAATVRQLIRFWYLLDQDKLVSAKASRTMKEIFASPDIPHDNLKFVKGLEGRGVTILRKWGTWQDWLHDTALVTGPGRRYILVGLIHHPRGDEYLEAFARSVDELLDRDRGQILR